MADSGRHLPCVLIQPIQQGGMESMWVDGWDKDAASTRTAALHKSRTLLYSCYTLMIAQ